MDMDFGINSKIELYKRLTPALTCKVRELKRNKINYIKKEDIWNYLLKTRWENMRGLDLSLMVDDILNLNNEELEKYVSSKLNTFNNEDKVEDEIELL